MHGVHVRLSSVAAAADAVTHAREVSVGAYLLRPGSSMVNALERAADAGADVHVRLGKAFRDPSGHVDRTNARVVKDLVAHGVHVTRTSAVEHLKAAVADGRIYLDDRNWNGTGDTVLVDDRQRDVAAVKTALQTGGAPPPTRDFALGKRDALRLECDVLERAGHHRIDVATETINARSTVERDLLKLAAHHHVRLLVAQRDLRNNRDEAAALAKLRAAGVEVRVGNHGASSEKFAVAGNCVWVGSANATGSPWQQPLDWGVKLDSASIARMLHVRFIRAWHCAKHQAG